MSRILQDGVSEEVYNEHTGLSLQSQNWLSFRLFYQHVDILNICICVCRDFKIVELNAFVKCQLNMPKCDCFVLALHMHACKNDCSSSVFFLFQYAQCNNAWLMLASCYGHQQHTLSLQQCTCTLDCQKIFLLVSFTGVGDFYKDSILV